MICQGYISSKGLMKVRGEFDLGVMAHYVRSAIGMKDTRAPVYAL